MYKTDKFNNMFRKKKFWEDDEFFSDLISFPAKVCIVFIVLGRIIQTVFFFWPIILIDMLLTSAEECIQKEHPDHKDLWRWIFMVYSGLIFYATILYIAYSWGK